ncbi:unnamed protein product [Owenia fusiformis]|uniref:Uncharacterized protein n=1 Tax=Owenia fusiformis TaxID=6347 RepID=A0A8J1TIG8_OWEFU|nr:unnamed protein product [Owenia fusiformis]
MSLKTVISRAQCVKIILSTTRLSYGFQACRNMQSWGNISIDHLGYQRTCQVSSILSRQGSQCQQRQSIHTDPVSLQRDSKDGVYNEDNEDATLGTSSKINKQFRPMKDPVLKKKMKPIKLKELTLKSSINKHHLELAIKKIADWLDKGNIEVQVSLQESRNFSKKIQMQGNKQNEEASESKELAGLFKTVTESFESKAIVVTAKRTATAITFILKPNLKLEEKS